MTLEIKTTAELLRLSHIKRWGIVQTAVPQTVAEHSWRVWALVREWSELAALTVEEKAWTQELALLHDVPEIRTGDCPTPAKTPEMKALLNEVEAEIYPPLAKLEKEANQCSKDYVKFCDIAEAVIFLHVNGIGKHAKDVEKLLKKQAEDHIRSSPLFATDHKENLIKALDKVLAAS
jgi:5'-deoxynucleotidase YfbR-like HD superfamily hydrolase